MSSAAIRSSCRGGVHVGAGTGSAEEGTGNTWDSDMVASWLSRAAIRRVFLFKPCGNLGCAFAVEGHGNDGLSLIGGKVAALAVMIDAIPVLLLGLSPLWLVSVVIGSFSVLHTG